ncbi:MAG: helix-turn-helix domain-containing protein [Bacteroidales bacterium]
MKERIAAILEAKDLTSSEFAQSLDIQRSNVSHILTGRNKPSYSFIEKLLTVYPEINASWLITGNGSMYIGGTETKEQALIEPVGIVERILPIQSASMSEHRQPISQPTNIQQKNKADIHQGEHLIRSLSSTSSSPKRETSAHHSEEKVESTARHTGSGSYIESKFYDAGKYQYSTNTPDNQESSNIEEPKDVPKVKDIEEKLPKEIDKVIVFYKDKTFDIYQSS